MIAYPATLPQPSVGFSGDVSTPTIRTQSSFGLIVQEGRFSTALETYRATWVLDSEELLTFEDWVGDTLAGGVLVFGLLLPEEGAYTVQPVRFVGGRYEVAHKAGLWFTVTATLECLKLAPSPITRTPAIPQWLRLAVDPALSQVLGVAHRHATLTVRPDLGSTTTLRIFPPTDPEQYIYFGINNQGEGETLITSADVDPLPSDTTPEFPASLPSVNQSFAFNAERVTVRMDMDSGHPRQYAGFETTRKKYQVEWEFSLEQLAAFQEFFYITLKNGAKFFTLTLPVDGSFLSVPVRFAGGVYSEAYVPVDRFKVSALVERVVTQTETPPAWQPYALHYTPTVNVNKNRRMSSDDAGKFFVVNPDEGQTISLHIYDLNIEFGILVKGLGNVLITRFPYIEDLGEIGPEVAAAEPTVATMALIPILVAYGSVGVERPAADTLIASMSILSVIVPVGSIGIEVSSANTEKAAISVLDVLQDAGDIGTETGSANTLLSTISIDIP